MQTVYLRAYIPFVFPPCDKSMQTRTEARALEAGTVKEGSPDVSSYELLKKGSSISNFDGSTLLGTNV